MHTLLPVCAHESPQTAIAGGIALHLNGNTIIYIGTHEESSAPAPRPGGSTYPGGSAAALDAQLWRSLTQLGS